MEQFIPVNIFQKKGTSEVLPFPRFDRTKICVDNQFQASFGEKAKILPVFCKWQDSIPSLFSVRNKNYPYHLLENFHRNFRKNGRRS